MGREVKGLIIGVVVSGAFHLVVLFFPLPLGSVVEVREIPGSVEVLLVAHQRARSAPLPAKDQLKEEVVRPSQQKIETSAHQAPARTETLVETLVGEGPEPPGEGAPERKGDSSEATPRYEGNPKPPYPQVARQRGYEGTVRLEVEVLTNGRVGRIRVKATSGHEILDRSALRTVTGWRFFPAIIGGVPVTSTVIIPATFKIEEE